MSLLPSTTTLKQMIILSRFFLQASSYLNSSIIDEYFSFKADKLSSFFLILQKTKTGKRKFAMIKTRDTQAETILRGVSNTSQNICNNPAIVSSKQLAIQILMIPDHSSVFLIFLHRSCNIPSFLPYFAIRMIVTYIKTTPRYTSNIPPIFHSKRASTSFSSNLSSDSNPYSSASSTNHSTGLGKKSSVDIEKISKKDWKLGGYSVLINNK